MTSRSTTRPAYMFRSEWNFSPGSETDFHQQALTPRLLYLGNVSYPSLFGHYTSPACCLQNEHTGHNCREAPPLRYGNRIGRKREARFRLTSLQEKRREEKKKRREEKEKKEKRRADYNSKERRINLECLITINEKQGFTLHKELLMTHRICILRHLDTLEMQLKHTLSLSLSSSELCSFNKIFYSF